MISKSKNPRLKSMVKMATGASAATTKRKRSTPQESNERMSALEAAALVLRESGGPMSCGEMVERMLARKLWSTSGKTPSATLYSAMLRQIEKGKESQFRKVARGKFALAS